MKFWKGGVCAGKASKKWKPDVQHQQQKSQERRENYNKLSPESISD